VRPDLRNLPAEKATLIPKRSLYLCRQPGSPASLVLARWGGSDLLSHTGVGRTLLSAAFELGVVLASPESEEKRRQWAIAIGMSAAGRPILGRRHQREPARRTRHQHAARLVSAAARRHRRAAQGTGKLPAEATEFIGPTSTRI
jgi:hypothetical protein